MKNTLLITGAAGFIGFHAAQQFARRGDHVIGLDNYNDYYDPRLKRERARILKEQHISIVEGDICDFALVEEIVKKNKVTHIVHLAAQAGVRYSLVNPQAYIKSNVEGFVNILEVCRKYPHIPLVYASSSSVYGRNEVTPFSTKERTDRQSSLYGVTKKTNELMADTYHHLYGIKVTGLRFFTVYGPWGRPDMAYYSFTKAILNNETIDIYNEGKLKRDFTYIDDIVSGIIAAADLQADCALFNLGNHQPVDVITFVETIEKALGKQAKKRYLPMQPGDVKETYADIDDSRERLGFMPQVSLDEGIKRFVKWYNDYLLLCK